MTTTTRESPGCARTAARLIVSKPWKSLAALVALVALSIIACALTPMDVNTGSTPLYARQTLISDRANAMRLLRALLPAQAHGGSHVTPAPAIVPPHQLQYNGMLDGDGTKSLTGSEGERVELHVIARARDVGGVEQDILQRRLLQQVCRVKAAVYDAQKAAGVCLSAAPPRGERPLWKATRVGDVEDANATGTGAGGDAMSAHARGSAGDCMQPISLLAVRLALSTLGYGRAYEGLVKLSSLDINVVTAVCRMEQAKQATILCSESTGLPCDASGCAKAGAARMCTIQGVDPCDVVNKLSPSAEELRVLSQLPVEPLDANGCDDIDWAGLNRTLAAARVMLAWADRAPDMSAMGSAVNALLDTQFLTRNVSSATRVVFGLPAGSPGDNGDSLRFAYSASRIVARLANADVEYSWRSWNYFDDYSNLCFLRDTAWALGALGFLLVYTWTQTGSAVLTLLAVAGVLAAFPLTVNIYALALGVRWVGVLHFLGLFILLGIGADNIFVLLEHWKLSRLEAPHSVEDRMAWTLGHSFSSISATTFTTVAAFAANMISPIAPVRLFGLFMVVLCSVNFLLLLVLVPTLLVLHHTRVGGPLGWGSAAIATIRWRLGMAPTCDNAHEYTSVCAEDVELSDMREKKVSNSDCTVTPPPDGLRHQPSWTVIADGAQGGRRHGAQGASAVDLPDGEADADAPRVAMSSGRGTAANVCADADDGLLEDSRSYLARLRCSIADGSMPSIVHAWLQNEFTTAIISGRWVILAVAFVVVSFFLSQALQLRLPQGRPTVWKASSNFNRYFAMETEFEFGRVAEKVAITLLWGVKPQDRGPLWTPYELGELVLQTQTQAGWTAPQSQVWLAALCAKLRQFDPHELLLGSVDCPLDTVAAYLRTHGRRLPVSEAELADVLQLLSGRPSSGLGSAVRFGTPAMLQDPLLYNSHTGALHPSLRPALNNATPAAGIAARRWRFGSDAGALTLPELFWGNRTAMPVTYAMTFTLNSTWTQPYVEVKRLWRKWEDWLNAELSAPGAPEGFAAGFQTSLAWQLMELREVVFASGRSSLMLSLALACATLVVVTGNVVIALLASACMSCVVIVFMGSMQLMGWTVGIVESVCVAVMVGLAVDYIVHMATCFAHCELTSSSERIAYALRTVGMSCMSGAVTTIGASIFLQPCEMAAFQQFGTLVIITLATALLFAMFVFPALCAVLPCSRDHRVGKLAVLLCGDWRVFLGLPEAPGGAYIPHQSDDAIDHVGDCGLGDRGPCNCNNR